MDMCVYCEIIRSMHPYHASVPLNQEMFNVRNFTEAGGLTFIGTQDKVKSARLLLAITLHAFKMK